MTTKLAAISILALSLAACAETHDAMSDSEDAMMSETEMSDTMMSDAAEEGDSMMSESMMVDG